MTNTDPPLPPEVQTVVDTYKQLSAVLAVPPLVPTGRTWILPRLDPRVERDLPEPSAPPPPPSTGTRATGGRKAGSSSASS